MGQVLEARLCVLGYCRIVLQAVIPELIEILEFPRAIVVVARDARVVLQAIFPELVEFLRLAAEPALLLVGGVPHRPARI